MELIEVVAEYLENTKCVGRIIISPSGYLYLGRDAFIAGAAIRAATDLEKHDVLPKLAACEEFAHRVNSDIDLRDNWQRNVIINRFSNATKLLISRSTFSGVFQKLMKKIITKLLRG